MLMAYDVTITIKKAVKANSPPGLEHSLKTTVEQVTEANIREAADHIINAFKITGSIKR